MTRHPFLARIAERIAVMTTACAEGVERPGLLVALSGGPDSVALFLGAVYWAEASGQPLETAHLDHTLRGADSDADLEFCRELCARHCVLLHELRRDPRPVARARGQGLEEAGRHLRRSLFSGILDGSPHLHCLATGHHRDDQVETVLMRLFRGTGPDGLRGILPVEGRTIRPLLDCERREILACLQEIGQPWRQDQSNLDGENVRARLRRELIPLLGAVFGEGSHRNPARLADLLAGDLDLLDRWTGAALAEARSGDGLQIARILGMEPPLAARVLRKWLNLGEEGSETAGRVPDGLSRAHIDGILRWLADGRSGTRLELPGGLQLEQSLGILMRGRPGREPAPLRSAGDYRILVETRDPAADPPALGTAEGNGLATGTESWELSCPAPCLHGNLQVRNPRPGDRFQPFGLDGSKKLSDLLLERRIPASQRASVLVVADGDGILWVVGLARAERTRLLPSTDKIVTICVAKRTDPLKQGN